MEISLNNTFTIEQYLSKQLSIEDTLLFKATLILDPLLRENVAAQRRLYELIRLYGRKKLKEELNAVHEKIFKDQANKQYCNEVLEMFEPKKN